ncbi:hypothetical protein K435DRAFT_661848 [Dendrothele bispora CBS 962.96]|uniref:Uncharacterized protein n=1 Tax=Dendrothele bispora (strain CBS 962.96) TaxID=1314807 RepID=A0A4S8M6S4_DENBC|nr:hypothetical protein K435DRAFT_661848 [Dendrothele bispora CBS 962.96]
MDAAELLRWTRFAAKGGIGKCTAKHDCVTGERELDVHEGAYYPSRYSRCF